MDLTLGYNGKIVKLMITQKEDNKMEEYEWNTENTNELNIAGRLWMAAIFEQKIPLRMGKNLSEQKNLIIDALSKDELWKMCEICLKSYEEEKCSFGDILFIDGLTDSCRKHSPMVRKSCIKLSKKQSKKLQASFRKMNEVD